MINRFPSNEPLASDACALARAAIELARPDDADSPRTKPAIEHVESCHACRQAVWRQQAIDRQIEDVCRDVPLPAGLKARLLAALEGAEPAAAVRVADSEAATDAICSNGRRAARRRLVVSLGGAAICALLASGGWLFWHWQQPPVELAILTQQAIDEASARLPVVSPVAGELPFPLPATMKTHLIGTVPRLLPAGEAGLYFFSMPLRGRAPVDGRLLVVSARRLVSPPTAASFLAGQALYLGGYCTTAWTEGDFVYVCCVKGGEDNLRRLLPAPRSTT